MEQIMLPLSFDRPTGPADWANRVAAAETATEAENILRTIETDIATLERRAGLTPLLGSACTYPRSVADILPGEWCHHIRTAPPKQRMQLAEAYHHAQNAFRECECHPFGKIAESQEDYNEEYGVAV
jgi:hypothetical protein